MLVSADKDYFRGPSEVRFLSVKATEHPAPFFCSGRGLVERTEVSVVLLSILAFNPAGSEWLLAHRLSRRYILANL